MIDKRQCRRNNRESFVAAIAEWRAELQERAARAPLSSLPSSSVPARGEARGSGPLPLAREASAEDAVRRSLAAEGACGGQQQGSAAEKRRVLVVARKRPLFEHEACNLL